MPGPTQVRIKRKRDEPVPDVLVLEHEGEHGVKKARENYAHGLRYIRQKHVEREGDRAAEDATRSVREGVEEEDRAKVALTACKKDIRREFYLKCVPAPAAGVKRRKDDKGEEGVATFEERVSGPNAKRVKAMVGNAAFKNKATVLPLKRPSKRAAVPSKAATPAEGIDEQQKKRLETLADDLHAFALEEIARPKVTAKPKLSAARSRDLHRQRMASAANPRIQDEAMADAEEGEYVFDTYVLAQASDAAAPGNSMQASGVRDVGYLVIAEEDQSVWDAYLEDEQASDRDWDTDEEDENAEDYYGADYPEDELASDDEFDRNAYGYRCHGGGSDDEEWDGDTGAYSDEEEYGRMMNPWKTRTSAGPFTKLIGGGDDGN